MSTGSNRSGARVVVPDDADGTATQTAPLWDQQAGGMGRGAPKDDS